MNDRQIVRRVVWGCFFVYSIACIVLGCGLVAASPHGNSELPQRLVVRRDKVRFK